MSLISKNANNVLNAQMVTNYIFHTLKGFRQEDMNSNRQQFKILNTVKSIMFGLIDY